MFEVGVFGLGLGARAIGAVFAIAINFGSNALAAVGKIYHHVVDVVLALGGMPHHANISRFHMIGIKAGGGVS